MKTNNPKWRIITGGGMYNLEVQDGRYIKRIGHVEKSNYSGYDAYYNDCKINLDGTVSLIEAKKMVLKQL